MSGVTFSEFLDLAIQIEKGSARYYLRAAQILREDESIRLATALAEEEDEHLRKITQLQSSLEGGSQAGEGRLNLTVDPNATLFTSSDIDECASPEEILKSAIERERETERLYEGLLGVEDLPDRWRELFTYLRDQEKAHAFRLGAILHRDEN